MWNILSLNTGQNDGTILRAENEQEELLNHIPVGLHNAFDRGRDPEVLWPKVTTIYDYNCS